MDLGAIDMHLTLLHNYSVNVCSPCCHQGSLNVFLNTYSRDLKIVGTWPNKSKEKT